MATGASFYTLSSPTALCAFIVGVSHYPFASLSLSFLGLFYLFSTSLQFPFPFSILPILPSSHHSHCFNGLFFFSKKEESVPQALLRAKALLVLLRVNLMKSLSTRLFLYRTPGTLPDYLSLRCLMVRPLRLFMLGCFLVRQVSLVPLRFQTLEKFLIFRPGRDFERQCLSFLISFRKKSKVGPSGWIRNYLMRSSWVAWSVLGS